MSQKQLKFFASLCLSFILGYSGKSNSQDDYLSNLNDSSYYGIGGFRSAYSSAEYLVFGIDFSFGFQIELGGCISFGMEYSPELNFNTIIKDDYFNMSDNNWYNRNYMKNHFNVFNVSLFYHFK